MMTNKIASRICIPTKVWRRSLQCEVAIILRAGAVACICLGSYSVREDMMHSLVKLSTAEADTAIRLETTTEKSAYSACDQNLAVIQDRSHVFCSVSLETRHSGDRESTRLNSSHPSISYAVFCL